MASKKKCFECGQPVVFTYSYKHRSLKGSPIPYHTGVQSEACAKCAPESLRALAEEINGYARWIEVGDRPAEFKGRQLVPPTWDSETECSFTRPDGSVRIRARHETYIRSDGTFYCRHCGLTDEIQAS